MEDVAEYLGRNDDQRTMVEASCIRGLWRPLEQKVPLRDLLGVRFDEYVHELFGSDHAAHNGQLLQQSSDGLGAHDEPRSELWR